MKLIELEIEAALKSVENNVLDYEFLGIQAPDEEIELIKTKIYFPIDKFISEVFYFFEYEGVVRIEFMDGQKMTCYNSIEELKKLYDTV